MHVFKTVAWIIFRNLIALFLFLMFLTNIARADYRKPREVSPGVCVIDVGIPDKAKERAWDQRLFPLDVIVEPSLPKAVFDAVSEAAEFYNLVANREIFKKPTYAKELPFNGVHIGAVWVKPATESPGPGVLAYVNGISLLEDSATFASIVSVVDIEGFYDPKTVMMHEFGHVLLLKDFDCPRWALMFGYLDGKPRHMLGETAREIRRVYGGR